MAIAPPPSWPGVQPSGDEPVDDVAASLFLASHPAGMGCPLAVVIAAYDEEASVGSVVASVPRFVAGVGAEVIVVVDGARDSTARRAVEAGALVCDVPVNRGQGAALRLGYRLARARGAAIIATLDADGQYDPGELDQVVAPIVAGEADLVSGSRRLGQELTSDRTRHAGVVLFAAVISVLIGQPITDPACGLRAMRSEVSEAVTLHQQQYQAAELMIGAALAGYRICEVPTTMRDRRAGATKKGGNIFYGARFAWVVLATWLRDRRRVELSRASAKITSS